MTRPERCVLRGLGFGLLVAAGVVLAAAAWATGPMSAADVLEGGVGEGTSPPFALYLGPGFEVPSSGVGSAQSLAFELYLGRLSQGYALSPPFPLDTRFPAAITGVIRAGDSGAPLAGATVELFLGPSRQQVTSTNGAGEYAFYATLFGDYVVRASRIGYDVATSDLLRYFGGNPLAANLYLWPVTATPKPDLYLSEADITWTVIESGALTATAFVHNRGFGAQDVKVRFLDEDLSTGRSVTTRIGTDQTIASLGQGAAEPVSLTWTPASRYHRVHVIVDPENGVSELSEADNAASRVLGALGRTPPRVASVTAQWDGDARSDVVGRFIAGVVGQSNKFTAIVHDDDQDAVRVEFQFGTQILVDSMGSDGWSATLDVGELPGEDVIVKVIAHDAAGLASEPKFVTVDMYSMPAWMLDNLDINGESVGFGFDFEGDYLKLSGSFSPPMAVSAGAGEETMEASSPSEDSMAGASSLLSYGYQFDPDIFFLGAKKNSFEGEISVDIWIPLSSAVGPRIEGRASVSQLYLSDEGCGTGNVYWDDSVQRCRDDVTGQFVKSACCRDKKEMAVEVELALNPDLTIESFYAGWTGEQRLLSIEYEQYIPITPPLSVVLGVGFDLFGRLAVGVGGEDALATYYLEFTPGLTAQVNGTLGVDLAYLARVEGVFSPSFSLDHSMRFEVPGGLTASTSGTWEVQWTVRVCVLWGRFCHDLASGGWGPYELFDSYPPAAASLAGVPTLELELTLPDPIAYPSLRRGPQNTLGLVWVRDVDPNSSRTDPEIYFAWADSAGAWSEAIPVTGGGGSDSLFQLNPAVAFEPSGKAVAVWTQNALSEEEASSGTLTLSQALDSQDIYWSRWNRESWSMPVPVIADSSWALKADGLPGVDVSPTGTGLLLWTRCLGDSALTQGTREIFYAAYDSGYVHGFYPENRVTDDSADDYSPAVACGVDSVGVAVWLRDVPGTGPMGAAENDVMASVYDGSDWTTPVVVASDSGLYRTPSVTRLPNGDALATWVVLHVADEDSSAVYTIEASRWSVATGLWGTPEVVDRSPLQIEKPLVNVDARNIAAIVWRGHNGFDGDLFCSVKDMDFPSSIWTQADTLTDDELTDWMLTATIDEQNNLHYVDLKSDLSGPAGAVNKGRFFDGLSLGSRGIQSDLMLSDELNFGFRPMSADFKVVADSFAVAPLYAAEGESVLVTAFTLNIGDVVTPQSAMRFYDGNPDSGGVVIGEDVNLPPIWPDGSVRVSNVWVAGPGVHRIYAVADPSGSVPEQTESNNRGFATVHCVPNLKVDALFISNENPLPGSDVTLSAIVSNVHGTTAAVDSLLFLAGDSVLSSCEVRSLAVGERDTCTLVLGAPLGETIFTAFADYDSTLLESDETDNSFSLTLRVMPDLVVYSDSLSCGQVDSVTYRYGMVLSNAGGVGADSVWVHFFDGAPLLDGGLIDSVFVDFLDALSDTALAIDWQPPVGLTDVFVVADRGDGIAERLEDNNEGHRAFIAAVMPEFAIASQDVGFYTPDWMTFHFTATVHNVGPATAVGVRVRFYDLPDSLTMTDIGARIIPVLEDSSTSLVLFEWTRPDTLARVVRVWVDPDSLVSESNRMNNWIEIEIREGTVSVGPKQPTVPAVVMLQQSVPNPFTRATTIRYGLPSAGRVRLCVYDAAGRLVSVLVDECKSPGYHAVVWDGKRNDGSRVSSGVYFYRLETEMGSKSRKVVLLK